MHQDVLSTPNESLISALDYVKTVVLKGELYNTENSAKVALGLRTYLASSADERRRELEEQSLRAQKEASNAKAIASAEQDMREMLEEDISKRDAEISELAEKNDSLAKEIESREKRTTRSRFGAAILGLALGATWWASIDLLWAKIAHAIPSLQNSERLMKVSLGIAGMLIFLVPALVFVRKSPWPYRVKMSVLTVVGIVGLGSSHLLSKNTWASSWTGIMEALVALAPLLLTSFSRHRSQRLSKTEHHLE